jgi:uncharacterized RDD family membrane protein YckC
MDLPLPADLDSNRPSLLASAGPDGASLVLLTAVSEERQILRHDRSPAGRWTQSTLEADLRRIAGIARLDSQVVAAIEDTAADSVLIAYLRASAMLPVATLPQPKRAFWLFPRGSELVMLQTAGPRSFSLTEIRPVDGSFGPTEQLVPQPMSSTRVWQLGLVVAVIVMSILLLFVVKPLIAPDSALPNVVRLLPASRRLSAMMLDLIPGAVIAVISLGCSPLELLSAPAMTFDAATFTPNVLMMAITAVYCGLFESNWSTTPGKWLMGGRVESLRQARPAFSMVLVRNSVKFLVLLVPPLGLVVLLTPHMQGLQDVAGRTLVVTREVGEADRSGEGE